MVNGKPQVSWLDHVQKYVNTVNHMFIAMVSTYTTYLCWQFGPNAFSLHAWLCTIGYQFLMCESIMALYAQNSWSGLHTRRTQTNLHWILQALGSGMAIAGMVVFYLERDYHLDSTHSIVGFVSLILTCLGILNGTSALWSRELMRLMRPVYTKLFHNVVGILAFVTGMVSLIYGFNKLRYNITRDVIVALQVLCGITLVISLIGAAGSLKRLVEGAFPGLFYREEDDDDEDGVDGKAAARSAAA